MELYERILYNGHVGSHQKSRLPESDAIRLLISGIGSRFLREVAVALQVGFIDEFLDEMHRITLSSSDIHERLLPIPVRSQKIKNWISL